jgi:hypothetical protein
MADVDGPRRCELARPERQARRRSMRSPATSPPTRTCATDDARDAGAGLAASA